MALRGGSWKEKASDNEVLRKLNDKRVMWKHLLNIRRSKWTGRLTRYKTCLVTIVEGKLERRKYKGWPRKQFMVQVTESVVAGSCSKIKKMALERKPIYIVAHQSED